MPSRVLPVLAALPLALGGLSPVPETTWIPSGAAASGLGTILAMERVGNTLYVAGDFTYFGPHTGSGVVLDQDSGAPKRGATVTGGHVQASLPDGSGGWYIGGDFTAVNEVPRERLAHLLADGSLDPAFSASANGVVWTLARL